MNHRTPKDSKETSSQSRRSRPLHLEQLEARLMNAIDAIELGLDAFTSSRLHTASQNDVAAEYGTPQANALGLGSVAPRIVRSVSFATGNVIAGNTTRASVLAADPSGEQTLVYRWSVIRSPSGSNVSFSANNSNAAKYTTLRFDRAGEYEIMATAVDGSGLTASSTSRLTVQPALTSIQVLTADGQVINPTSGFTTAQADPVFRIQGRDQFGQVLSQTPTPVWSLRGGPPNATMTQSAQGEFTRFNFSQQEGSYSLQASVGNQTVQLAVQSVRSSARLDLIDSSGRVLQDGALVDISSDRAPLTIQPVSSQGVALATPSNVTCTIMSGPAGGTVRTTMQGSRATIIFNRVGTYNLAIQANGFTRRVQFRVNPVLTSLAVSPSSISVQAGQTRQFTASRLDQFGMAMSTTTAVTWSAVRGTISTSGLFTAMQSPGVGSVTAAIGGIRSTVQVTVVAAPAVTTSLQVRDTSGNVLGEVTPVPLSGRQLRVEMRIVNSASQVVSSSPLVTMTVNTAPTNGSATLAMSGGTATIDFTRAGTYELTFASGGATRKLRVAATATLTSLQVTPSTASIQTGQTRQFTVAGIDQFGQTMSNTPSVTWSATGGTISSSGLFTAGSTAGSASVRAQTGSISATASISITAPSSQFQNAALSQLVQTYYVDQLLDRTEVMALLRSVGSDSVVDATELADLRTLVSSTQYVMPAHVRGLARNTVTDNPANLKFQGQAAGNLAAGASSSLLNKLVDKWFLGVDVPALAGQATGYTRSTGTLFNVGPTLADAKQGMIGDCYFIAALGSIAGRSQQAIRDIFDDNGDGTFTVRFFGRNSSGAATADYVTVDRRLPTQSGGILAYAGYGFSATNASTVLWIGLAEKAYAQWNETQRAGRDGTNSYAGIEGGWMANVNFQILGYNSTNYSFATATQQTLISALDSGLAVTTGTKPSVSSGLVGSHAYSITGYNRSTGRFTVLNPWGFMHPAPLTWSELQANFTLFTTTSPQGSGADVLSNGFRSEFSVMLAAPEHDHAWLRIESVVRVADHEPEILALRAADGIRIVDSLAVVQVAEMDSFIQAAIEEESSESDRGLDEPREDRFLKDLALMDLYIQMIGRFRV